MISENDKYNIELRKTAYTLAHELTIASNKAAFNNASIAIGPLLPDIEGVVKKAKVIHDYIAYGK